MRAGLGKMADRGPTGRARLRAVLLALSWLAALSLSAAGALAQIQLPGYAQAEDAFMRLSLDERVKLQILLTAAGYWPAVPDADFSGRLFNAISRFEADNGFAPVGILNSEQMDCLGGIAGPYLNAWRFQVVRHPMTGSWIWVPLGLPLREEATATGLTFFNRPLGVVLSYDYYPQFTLRLSFEALRNKLLGRSATIYYSKLYRNEFFAFSWSDGITDAYARYHQTGRGGVGFTLTWNHAATDAHIERIATLISGSLWSSASGAPFTGPFTVRTAAPEVASAPGPAPNPPPAPGQEEPHRSSSGTGIFVTSDGRLVTNAHVVKGCRDIEVGMGHGDFEPGKLVAADPINDLALLKVNATPEHAATLRFDAKQGENVEVFGYPLSDVLASSGNFTTGIVTALAGIGNDSQFYQISAPVQPGNSGGPLLDENGNLIGVVSAKLNPFSEIKAQGDIPENVNFAIKASVVANFLQDNAVRFAIGEATQPMKGPDLADEAKALSAFIVCR